MQAFLSRSPATNLSLPLASGSSRIDAQLPQVRGPQQVRDVVHGRGGELRQDLGLDLEELPAERLAHADAVVVSGRYSVSSGPVGSMSV